MNGLKLTEPTIHMEIAYRGYISEWENASEKIVPYGSKSQGKPFADTVDYWREMTTPKAYETGFVPATLFFLVDNQERIYGAIQIRHELNENLLKIGGHIGYGIRPSERKKGYAGKMLKMALPYAKALGIEKLLITCDKDNLASAKTIINNGGILENEVLDDGIVKQRYWITL